MKRTPAETIAAYFAATRAMDCKAWVACFDPAGVSHDPVGTPPHRGPAALGAFFDGIVGATKTIGLDAQEVFFAGDEAAVRWRGHGTNKQGKAFEFNGIDVMRFGADGLIVELHGYWDPRTLMAQL